MIKKEHMRQLLLPILIIVTGCSFQENSLRSKELYYKNKVKIKCVLMVRQNDQQNESFVNKLAKLSHKEFLVIPVSNLEKIDDYRIYYISISYKTCNESIDWIQKRHKAKFKRETEIKIVNLKSYTDAYQGQYKFKD